MSPSLSRNSTPGSKQITENPRQTAPSIMASRTWDEQQRHRNIHAAGISRGEAKHTTTATACPTNLGYSPSLRSLVPRTDHSKIPPNPESTQQQYPRPPNEAFQVRGGRATSRNQAGPLVPRYHTILPFHRVNRLMVESFSKDSSFCSGWGRRRTREATEGERVHIGGD